jgi:type I restriction enzyme S subunit
MAGEGSAAIPVADLIEQGKLFIGDGYRAKNVELAPHGLPFARVANINGGFRFEDVDRFPESDLARVGNKVSRPGDVVFTSKGSVGRFAFVDESIPRFVYSPQLCFWRSLDWNTILPRFLYYWMASIDFQHQYKSVAGQTDMADFVSLSDQRRMRITLPPLPEQRAIAHILGTLDDKIELNRRMNATLEGMARALFKSWFVDFDPVRARMDGRDTGLPPHIAALFPDRLVESELGEVPEGWEVGTLGDVCEKPQYGYTASASEDAIGPKFLRITDINKRDWIEWENVPFCAIEAAESGKYALTPGDIVIARMADPGHGALVEEAADAVFASYLIRFRPRQRELRRFLQYWLRSDTYWDLVHSRESGTTRANLNAPALGSFPLVIPDLRVLQAFATSVDSLRDKVVANAQESCTLAALRDALLPKLLSGEVRVGEPERFIEKIPS